MIYSSSSCAARGAYNLYDLLQDRVPGLDLYRSCRKSLHGMLRSTDVDCHLSDLSDVEKIPINMDKLLLTTCPGLVP